MLKSLVSLREEKFKKSEKSMKIVNIEGENLRILWAMWETSTKFSGKMWLTMILKVTKKQGFTLTLKYNFFGKQQRTSNWPPPPPPPPPPPFWGKHQGPSNGPPPPSHPTPAFLGLTMELWIWFDYLCHKFHGQLHLFPQSFLFWI